MGAGIEWREAVMNGLKWEKLTTGVFWGGNGGPWWRGLHEQQVFYLYKPVLLKHDGLILKALKICIGNQAGALSLRSPFHVTLSSPPPISQSTKPGKSISLPLIRKCGTSCSQHDCDWNGRKAWKRISTETAWLGIGRSLYLIPYKNFNSTGIIKCES